MTNPILTTISHTRGRRLAGLSILTLLLLLVLVCTRPAQAQLDAGNRSYDIFQQGVKVGEIFVVAFRTAGPPDAGPPDAGPPDRSLSLEHWVLGPNYVNPSEFNGMTM